jgi:hypothetical protein
MSDRQGVEIDFCPQCRGVWLDRGELDKIIERTAATLTPAAAPPPLPAAPQQVYRRHDDDDDDDDDYRRRPVPGQPQAYPPGQGQYPQGQHYPKKKKSFLGDLFDF